MFAKNEHPKKWSVTFVQMLRISLISILTILFLSSFCQDWELRKNEDGIKVYTKPTKGDGFDSFRAVMEINLRVSEIEDFLRHMDKYRNAFPDTKELEILERPNDSTQIQYALTDAPWPVSDRDGVYELVFHVDKKTGNIQTVARALPDYLPKKEDVVRIEKSNTFWNVDKIDDNKSRLEYIVHADPGGSIPEWLANSAAVDVPFDTFYNIRKALSK